MCAILIYTEGQRQSCGMPAIKVQTFEPTTLKGRNCCCQIVFKWKESPWYLKWPPNWSEKSLKFRYKSQFSVGGQSCSSEPFGLFGPLWSVGPFGQLGLIWPFPSVGPFGLIGLAQLVWPVWPIRHGWHGSVGLYSQSGLFWLIDLVGLAHLTWLSLLVLALHLKVYLHRV